MLNYKELINTAFDYQNEYQLQKSYLEVIKDKLDIIQPSLRVSELKSFHQELIGFNHEHFLTCKEIDCKYPKFYPIIRDIIYTLIEENE